MAQAVIKQYDLIPLSEWKQGKKEELTIAAAEKVPITIIMMRLPVMHHSYQNNRC